MASVQQSKTDLGTIIIHWLMVICLGSAAVTGLAIASADYPNILLFYHVGFVLPSDNIWLYHIVFGASLTALLLAYALYIKKAHLTARIALDRARLRGAFRDVSAFLGLGNVLLYWSLFAAFVLAIGTGFLLFFEVGGGAMLLLHLHSTWFFVAFLVLHPLLHWFYGGKAQLLRIVRPRWRLPQQAPQLVDALIERLRQLDTESGVLDADSTAPVPRRRTQRHATVLAPLAIAAVASGMVMVLGVATEKTTRPKLEIMKIAPDDAPSLSGEMSSAAWRHAPVAKVVMQHGANFDNGESVVEIRAIHDGTSAYFSFTWTDPTRSLTHMPLVKRGDGWHLTRSAAPGNETRLHEDQFAVLLTAGGQPLIGKGIHLGRQPLDGKPEGATGRGLHAIEVGTGDIWQWRASHGGLLGWIDNGRFGKPLPAPEPGTRYTGGFSLKAGPLPYQNNFTTIAEASIDPIVRPSRFPSSVAGILRLASLSLDPEASDAEGTRPWVDSSNSVPYTAEIDRLIPVGAVIPSIVLDPEMISTQDPSRPTGGARWSGGRWSLEIRRRLNTGNADDVIIKTGALMWVSAFDHAETWHAYHIRPLELEVK